MRKIYISLLATLMMSSYAVAGKPVEASAQIADVTYLDPIPGSTEEVDSDDNGGFYLGASYSTLGIDIEGLDYIYLNDYGDSSSVMGQAGYKFNPYISIEGRYWSGENSFDAWGLYAKPSIPLGDLFSMYGIIGYGNAGIDMSEVDGEGHYNILDESTLQWGLGLSVSFSENFALFADYVEIYNDQLDIVDWSLDTINIGATVTF
ncbi:putative outer membrane protein A [hydrothermal vent metagenome]|uniref:Putative outer membrane protein A n=1 Tax=hydrothermal vent metagenome TaxID=652676 RepID=A0A1W1C1N1_9ZZZZ